MISKVFDTHTSQLYNHVALWDIKYYASVAAAFFSVSILSSSNHIA